MRVLFVTKDLENTVRQRMSKKRKVKKSGDWRETKVQTTKVAHSVWLDFLPCGCPKMSDFGPISS